MSRKMSDSELLEHCQTAIQELKKLLEEFCSSSVEKLKERAMFIGYWIPTCVNYWKKEDNFSPKSVFRLKRGSVIRVEFGYRIGQELGGRHYAVVIDANNRLHRGTVTVVPLGSKKEDWKENPYSIALTDGFYNRIVEKQDVSNWPELQNLKQGSIARVDQITTISKMRISAPLKKNHPLYGVRLSPQDMNSIDAKILELYFSQKSE